MPRSPRNSKTPGRKAPNIYDVAREAQVSVFTVSAVINKKDHVGAARKRRVEAAIQKLDYRLNSLAQSLASERTHTIGVVVPDISNPFFPMVVRGAEDAAQKRGYSTLLCNSDGNAEKEELYLELLLSKRVDGVLLTKAPGQLSSRIERMIADMKVPVVLMMRTSPRLTKDALQQRDTKFYRQRVLWPSPMKQQTLKWNPATQKWFCPTCGRTSDHVSVQDAQIELDQYECRLPQQNVLSTTLGTENTAQKETS